MFAVLLAATALIDPDANPALYDRLMTRFVAAMSAAADRHPGHAGHLRTQTRFIQLDAQIREVGNVSREEASAFLLNLIQSHQQVVALADQLADPVLDTELLSTQPALIWANVTHERRTRRQFRDPCGLQGVAQWYSYRRNTLPAVARVVGYTTVLASRRF